MQHPLPFHINPSSVVEGLYGLVLIGGESKRMGTDKALITHQGEAFSLRAYRLLLPLCERVFLSGRSEQFESASFKALLGDLPRLEDRYASIGPMAGVLTAMEACPEAAWLVLACDMPHVDCALLSRLVQYRNPEKEAIVFARPSGLEPLCALYEPSCRKVFQSNLDKGIYSLRKGLQSLVSKDRLVAIPANSLPDEGDKMLESLNSPEELMRYQSS